MVFPNSSKVDVFWVSFGLNFEDEGANICLFFLIFFASLEFREKSLVEYIVDLL